MVLKYIKNLFLTQYFSMKQNSSGRLRLRTSHQPASQRKRAGGAQDTVRRPPQRRRRQNPDQHRGHDLSVVRAHHRRDRQPKTRHILNKSQPAG